MSIFEHSIDVNVPVSVAYNQWTQFESFPNFMDHVEYVRQKDDETLEWHANIAGNDLTWTAKITEQTPDHRIAWTNISGAPNAGVVSFHKIDDGTTRVMFQIEYDPDGFVESVGDALGFVERSMTSDLENFKEFIEARSVPTGAWRGTIE